MHGRVKVRTTEEEKKRKEKERAQKVVVYQSCMKKIMQMRKDCKNDQGLLQIISEVLVRNPDIYTLWNIRRETLLVLSKSIEDETELSNLFDAELNLTEHCLKLNPKSYCAWHHRVWVLDERKDADWKKEIDLCNYYLKMDERNFHCWDYRRQIVQRADIPSEEEFTFTTKKIKDNFSNYSSWHYRSKLLVKLFPDIQGERPIRENNHRDELEMVLNAAFTDPNDTSAWFYQRWLLGGIKKDVRLAACRVSPDESLISFSHNVNLNYIKKNLKILLNNVEVDGEWYAVQGLSSDIAWYLKHNQKLNLTGEDSLLVYLKLSSSEEQNLHCQPRGMYCIGIPDPGFRQQYGPFIIEELNKQLESCNQLMEFEPDSKWTLLATAVIMYALDLIEHHEEILKILKQLISVDGLRAGYYKDLASKMILENYLENNIGDLRMCDAFSGFAQKDFSLCSLYHFQYWIGCRIVNLNNQELTERSLPVLSVLRYCEELDLSMNNIRTLKGFPILPNLREIIVDGFDADELQYLAKCENLQKITVLCGEDSKVNINIEVVRGIIPGLTALNIV